MLSLRTVRPHSEELTGNPADFKCQNQFTANDEWWLHNLWKHCVCVSCGLLRSFVKSEKLSWHHFSPFGLGTETTETQSRPVAQIDIMCFNGSWNALKLNLVEMSAFFSDESLRSLVTSFFLLFLASPWEWNVSFERIIIHFYHKIIRIDCSEPLLFSSQSLLGKKYLLIRNYDLIPVKSWDSKLVRHLHGSFLFSINASRVKS